MGSKITDLSGLQVWQDLAQNEGRECVIGAVILNAQGRAFVQKRSHERRLFPGSWDIVGGHVEPGETLYEGLHREIAEETGRHLERVVSILVQFSYVAHQKSTRQLNLLVQVERYLDTPHLEWAT